MDLTLRAQYRELVVGCDCKVQTADGRSVTAVNFDNAATTPPLHGVMERIFHFSEVYSSVHRGWGYKSMISSDVYERGRSQLLRFVGANEDAYSLIYTKHTTEALNLLAHVMRQRLADEDVVLVSEMEHLANYLPWRMKMQTDLIPVDDAGRVRLAVLEEKLRRYGGRVKLVCISGASNVTGYVNDLSRIAKIVHRHGAMLVADGAQLLAHRRFNMMGADEREAIDFVALSAHKMYAPFGCGALIGRKDVLEGARPLLLGGGVARLATHEKIDWSDAPYVDEAGTPNVIGIAAWLEAIRILTQIGWDKLECTEMNLFRAMVQELKNIEGIRLYGGAEDGVSLVSFACEGIEHRIVGYALAEEEGIGVRSGMFCAHPYVVRLLQLTKKEIAYYQANRLATLPGMVRVSLSFYNTEEEVERFVKLMRRMMKHRKTYRKRYAHILAERDGDERQAWARWMLP